MLGELLDIVKASNDSSGKPSGAAALAEKPKSADAKPRTQKRPNPPKEGKAKPAENPPARSDVVYGITLGSTVKEATVALAKRGWKISSEPFEKSGKTYYAVEGMRVPLPYSLESGVAHRHFYVVFHNGGVLSVNVELEYDKSRSFDDLKAASQQGIPSIAGTRKVVGMRTVDNVFSHEINFAISNTYGIWVVVTDKGNGACRLEIQHISLYGLSDYWSGKKK
jgi:hypothetical protein